MLMCAVGAFVCVCARVSVRACAGGERGERDGYWTVRGKTNDIV